LTPNHTSTANARIRVLLVDDEVDRLSITEAFLREDHPQFSIVATDSPSKALELLPSEDFDCIVSDYQMTEIDGLELATKIRETSDVPIIICTGRGSEEVAEKAFAVGVDDYIRKEPSASHFQLLARRIRMAVEKRRAEMEVRRERDRAQTYLDIVGVLLVGLDTKGRITLLNRKACEIMGCEAEEMIGRDWFTTFREPGLRDDLRRKYHSVMRGEIPHIPYNVSRIYRDNGDFYTIQWHNVILKDERGNITGSLSSGTDITERMRIERKLRENERTVEMLMGESA